MQECLNESIHDYVPSQYSANTAVGSENVDVCKSRLRGDRQNQNCVGEMKGKSLSGVNRSDQERLTLQNLLYGKEKKEKEKSRLLGPSPSSSFLNVSSLKQSVCNLVQFIVNKKNTNISQIINYLLCIILLIFSLYSIAYSGLMFKYLDRMAIYLEDVTMYQNLNVGYANQTLNSIVLYQYQQRILKIDATLNEYLT